MGEKFCDMKWSRKIRVSMHFPCAIGATPETVGPGLVQATPATVDPGVSRKAKEQLLQALASLAEFKNTGGSGSAGCARP
jgi:hypothetical protein